MSRWLALVLLFLAGPAWGQPSKTLSAQMRNLVVMLEVRGDSGGPACAAGILVAYAPDRVLVLTAAHVLQKPADDLGQDPSTLRTTAEFGWMPGKLVAATPVANVRGADLDYMVFSISGGDIPALPDLGALSVLPTGSDALDVGSGVVEVGNPGCHRWEHSLTPSPIKAIGGAEIQAETRTAGEGSSGGALFSADGALIGMIQTSGQGSVVARPIGLLLGELRRQGLRVDLTERAFRPSQANTAERPGPTQAAQFGRGPVKVAYNSLAKDGYGFNVTPAPGYNNVKEVRLSGAAETVIGRRLTGSHFELTTRKAMTEPLFATVVFEDGSALPRTPLDVRSIVEARIDRMEQGPQGWASCDLVSHRCRLSLSDEQRALIEHIEVGATPKTLTWRLLPSAVGPQRGLNELLNGETFIVPASASAMTYRIHFVGGRVTPVRQIPLMDRPCPGCARDLPLVAKPLTPGAPEIAYLFQPAFPRAEHDYLRIFPPPALAGAKLEMDPDGRGLLPSNINTAIADPPATLAFRFTLANGERLGPFTYQFDYATPAIAAAQGDVDIICGPRKDERRLCAISAPQVLHEVKQIRVGLDPDKFTILLRPEVSSENIADRKWRQGFARCWSPFYNAACTDAWMRIKGATFEIPAAASDLYLIVEGRDGVTGEAVRIPLQPPR